MPWLCVLLLQSIIDTVGSPCRCSSLFLSVTGLLNAAIFRPIESVSLTYDAARNMLLA